LGGESLSYKTNPSVSKFSFEKSVSATVSILRDIAGSFEEVKNPGEHG